MLEFLVALLLFSTGAFGLLQAQLAGQQGLQAALDRSRATALGRDLLGRMETNPGQEAYFVDASVLGAASLPPMPPVDCYRSPCAPDDLASFDHWHWQRQLVGQGDDTQGRVADGRACIQRTGATLTLDIAWRGRARVGSAARAPCAEDALYRPPGDVAGASQRRQLRFAAFAAGTS